MNILFLTLIDFESIKEHGIYQDLLNEFTRHNHKIYVISPVERRKKQGSHIVKESRAMILKLKIGNTQKTNLIEKGLSTVSIEPVFIFGIKKYFSDIKFDLVLYSTPPITFCKAVEFVKKRDHAKAYLLLKDIFPQNAVDIGIMSTSGLKGMLYRFFRNKEKRLYAVSDCIGCMSPANVDYILKHNPEINPSIVDVCPNSIEVIDKSVNEERRTALRRKYGIPLEKKVFVYGGNLGLPQGVGFLIECLKSQKENKKVFFLIIGDGTEFMKLESFVKGQPQKNVELMKQLPREEYDSMVGACDVGMIFLDHRFTIPNFPSRLISYMQAKLPVLAVTDPTTDIGKVIAAGNFGWWCESNSVEKFHETVKLAADSDLSGLGKNGFKYLNENYSTKHCYEKIMKQLGDSR